MKISILFALLALPTISFADEGRRHERMRGGGFGEQLTAQQRECVEEHNCPPIQMRETPTEAERAARRECMNAAMEACGIERPERSRERAE